MGGVLRVDPTRLRSAATAEGDVGTFVSGLATGQSMAGAGSGMSGLLTEDACRFAAATFDAAAAAVHRELTTHAENLASAADRYHQTDSDLGRHLRKIAK